MKKCGKQVKSMRLSGLHGVHDVAMGHKAPAEMPHRTRSKAAPSAPSTGKSPFADVNARNKRWGIV